MPTGCISERLRFEGYDGCRVIAAFDGGAITSDTGSLPLRETDKAIKLFGRIADCLVDRRKPELQRRDRVNILFRRAFHCPGMTESYDLRGHGKKGVDIFVHGAVFRECSLGRSRRPERHMSRPACVSRETAKKHDFTGRTLGKTRYRVASHPDIDAFQQHPTAAL